MELTVEVRCLCDETCDSMKLTLVGIDTKTVRDIKLDLQDLLEAPMCDQVLYYRGHLLTEDSLPLRNLYMRENDSITVEFPARASITDMDNLLEGLQDFSHKVKTDSRRILRCFADKNNDAFLSYDRVLWSLETLAFSHFIPWKEAVPVANRHYFVQQGGFEAFVAVMEFSSKRYEVVQSTSNTRDSEEVKNLLAQVKHMNNEQRALQTNCLSFMWNFSESRHDRQLVLKYGGLKWVTEALLLEPLDESMDEHERWHTVGIHESAVGCLVQYVEFPHIQEAIAKNWKAVNQLTEMVESALEMKPCIFAYGLYNCQIAANALFCCAGSLTTPKILVDNEVHLKILQLTKTCLKYEGHDVALGYYCCLFLARIRSSPMVALNSAVAQDIDAVITKFMSQHEPEDIAEWEDAHHYVWVSVLPFLSIAFAGGHFERKGGFQAENCNSDSYRSRTVKDPTKTAEGRGCGGSSLLGPGDKVQDQSSGLENVEVEMTRCQTDQLSQRLDPSPNDDNPCLRAQFHSDAACAEPSTSVAVTFNSTQTADVEESAPWPGSPRIQAFGVFTMKSMLQSKENVQLLQSEGLLPYAVCLTWKLCQTEQDLLTEELRKLKQIEVPSLKVISKSVLARMSSLEMVFKM